MQQPDAGDGFHPRCVDLGPRIKRIGVLVSHALPVLGPSLGRTVILSWRFYALHPEQGTGEVDTKIRTGG
jgi:hypothetical protein